MESRFWRLAAPIAALLGVFAGSNAWAALSVDTVSARADLVSRAPIGMVMDHRAPP